jgi:hypothetical protein
MNDDNLKRLCALLSEMSEAELRQARDLIFNEASLRQAQARLRELEQMERVH